MNNNTKAFFEALKKGKQFYNVKAGFIECEGCFRSKIKGFYLLSNTIFLVYDTHRDTFEMLCPCIYVYCQLSIQHHT